jgi:membrane associated rhomboid family serine protease
MNGLFANMPPVVKNLLILNVLMFIVSIIGESQGIPMTYLLGGYVFGSPFFEPYQMVTHFFMHSTQSFFHIFFNMFALVVFGSVLERVWGAKRFFIFYVATAVGAFVTHQLVGYIQLQSILKEVMALENIDIHYINKNIADLQLRGMMYSEYPLRDYQIAVGVPVVGASGAIYGILAGFAFLFPNTQLMLLFPPIPVKAKWLVLFLVGLSLINIFNAREGDNVAHLAHLGGALVGFIIVLFWQKNSRNFY